MLRLNSLLAAALFASLLASCGDVDDDQAKAQIVNALYSYDTLDLVIGDQVKVEDLPYGEISRSIRLGVTDKENEDPNESSSTTTPSPSSSSTSTLPALRGEADLEALVTSTSTITSSTTTTTTSSTTTTTTIPTGTRTLVVFVDSLATRLIEQDVTLVAQQRYSLYAYQGIGSGERARLIVQQEAKQKFSGGKLKIRVADMAPSSGIVDVYVLEPGQTIAGTPASSALAPTGITEYFDVAPGTYRVVLARVGTVQVVFDSGPIDVTAGTLVTMVVLDKKGGGTPLEFLVDTR